MIAILNWADLDKAAQEAALTRAKVEGGDISGAVRAIMDEVRRDGDAALRHLTKKFDGCDMPVGFVSQEEFIAAEKGLPAALRTALLDAINAIEIFHKAQMPKVVKVETRPGVLCELQWRAIERVGLYVPGGSAPLLSTLLMLAIPAHLAGCLTCILCTPPGKDGSIDSGILAAARLCGITQVLPLGGAQAIAALAYGTETVPKVDKIFGPGNAYVTIAKQLAAQQALGPAIDTPAGPSEVMVLADAAANPAWIAADLLAQLEHGPDSQALLVALDAALARAVQSEIEKRRENLSRKSLIDKSLVHSHIIVAPDLSEAFEIVNRYAPEHLILSGRQAAEWVGKIQNAGSVFVGAFAPETAGDYASGTNHVLPTAGAARAYGSLSLTSFMKTMSVQTITQQGLAALAPTLTTLAQAEGLDAHAAAVTVRTEAA